ncbi:MAG: sigma-70 family RNA polymerase sigma factor [Clostridium tyrobutyricum]|jgi:RNA polymerase sigma factor (sigma-70 family)|uniref:Sigma-70 family RNA polymerase sigma factor n=1 Tax=Clostridium tetanomorphum TaxID=1553 RepID=A0A923EEM1_CLOTT|nr:MULTISPECIES: sigma factor-like helix-turn-helix DNA-binding protein [Clostridium]EJO5348280.1 sigma-70 family RNA polymerase sigma factor [Clostridium botulinum]MBC2399680.1 sigma-70 family RNA polymerase sigma factor [Clostridium tetanomorphum]MBV4420339.1 sigma-70 family RNA polymerase sigma factor [Clostridium tyrobutyricum]MCH4198537.1 sigma-70 family RNA polymerase sigma factor [Clostridium tyrobutyricum]MCH4238257.1 sigma-70 family RNA polymerase sigma factor [Clostridium tyrobutyric
MKRVIKIGKELVEVSEELYKEYYKMGRRERYMQNDIKLGRIDVDMEKQKVTFVDSKEDSVERLIDKGLDFKDAQAVEDIVCDKAMLFILQKAMEELDCKEQELIKSIYYKNLTVREVAKEENVSHVAIVKRHKKILEKLKKYFL